MYLAQFLEKPYVNTAVARRRLEVAEIRADSNAAIVIAAADRATSGDDHQKDHDHLKDHDFLPC
jgi:hypothetical protein